MTLKNFRNALIAGLIVFAAISIRSEMRRPSHGDYGRLFKRNVPEVEPLPPRMEVVQEAEPVADETTADPMLLAPAAREQYLGAGATVPPLLVPAEPLPVTAPRDGGLAIVGNAGGVTVTTIEGRGPVLSGGIFRQ